MSLSVSVSVGVSECVRVSVYGGEAVHCFSRLGSFVLFVFGLIQLVFKATAVVNCSVIRCSTCARARVFVCCFDRPLLSC